MLRTYKTEGIIIKRKNFGETDRILTIFSKYNGKLQIKAPGVRKISSRRSPHVELLNLSLLTLHKGKGMPFLVEAETIENFHLIKNDLTKVGFSYHICELIDGLCAENQENRSVFFLLQKTLQSLIKEEEDIISLIHGFEVELLTILGFWTNAKIMERKETEEFIEKIMERRLKSKNFLRHLS